jgi:hypothetical protein
MGQDSYYVPEWLRNAYIAAREFEKQQNEISRICSPNEPIPARELTGLDKVVRLWPRAFSLRNGAAGKHRVL